MLRRAPYGAVNSTRGASDWTGLSLKAGWNKLYRSSRVFLGVEEMSGDHDPARRHRQYISSFSAIWG